jgi:hypothetical protein
MGESYTCSDVQYNHAPTTPPLPTATLQDMAKRHRSPEVRALLWEISRLRAVLVTISGIERSLTLNALGLGEDGHDDPDDLRSILRREPSVREALEAGDLSERDRKRIARDQRG